MARDAGAYSTVPYELPPGGTVRTLGRRRAAASRDEMTSTVLVPYYMPMGTLILTRTTVMAVVAVPFILYLVRFCSPKPCKQ